MDQTREEIVDFQCPHCHVHVRAGRDKRGKKGLCPQCNFIIRIPAN